MKKYNFCKFPYEIDDIIKSEFGNSAKTVVKISSDLTFPFFGIWICHISEEVSKKISDKLSENGYIYKESEEFENEKYDLYSPIYPVDITDYIKKIYGGIYVNVDNAEVLSDEDGNFYIKFDCTIPERVITRYMKARPYIDLKSLDSFYRIIVNDGGDAYIVKNIGTLNIKFPHKYEVPEKLKEFYS